MDPVPSTENHVASETPSSADICDSARHFQQDTKREAGELMDVRGVDMCATEETEEDFGDRVLRLECYKYGAMAELRKSFEKLWKSVWGKNAGAEAFNAWLFAALNICDSTWLPIPGCESASVVDPAVTGPIETWALLQVPCDWPLANNLSEAVHNLERYIDALREPPRPPLWEGIPKAALETAIAALPRESWEDPLMVQASVRRLFWPLVASAISLRTRELARAAVSIANDVRARWSQLAARSVNERSSGGAAHLRIVETLVSRRAGEEMVRFELCGPMPEEMCGKLLKSHQIHRAHAEKLHRLFQAASCVTAPFRVHCWALLTRYRSIFGPHDQGGGWHMAVTETVLQNLVDDFGVRLELFASPLNCSLQAYCSAFKDTDSPFGSSGSFFDFPLAHEGGSFECNPPFESHLLRRTIDRLLVALSVCPRPLSIAFVVPDWPDNPAICMALAASCCRAVVSIAGEGHVYINGRQHYCSPKHRRLCHHTGRGSLILFLQNDAGTQAWPTTEDRLERHRQAWFKRDGRTGNGSGESHGNECPTLSIRC